MTMAWSAALGYLIGSVPIGYVLARLWHGMDLRREGSGNIGATNAFRAAGPRLGVVVLAGDIAKGVVSVMLAGAGGEAAAGVAAVVGHVYPIWLRFRGGKGVATAAGAFALIAPWPTAIAAGAFAVVVAGTRYVSLGSMVGAVTLAVGAWLMSGPFDVTLAITGVAGLVLLRHRDNAVRLLRKTEPALGA
jgi:glycerol-3-phosphate acyltransferase PlsY